MLNTQQRRAFKQAARNLPIRILTGQPANTYDVSTATIRLAAGASKYEMAHETAHFIQHQHNTPGFVLHLIACAVIPFTRIPLFPWLRNLARYFAEVEADNIARHSLLEYGEASEQTDVESAALLRHYKLRLFLP